MRRFSIALILLAMCSPARAQVPANFDKVAFFGDVLAVTAFCGLIHYIDQYELGEAMKAFGVTSADRATIEAARDKSYQTYRDKFRTAREHGDFCISTRSHPFFIKALRRGMPITSGSDTNKQEEKIEQFGNLVGAMSFCKMRIDGEKFGRFIVDMGVQSESLPAITAHANKVQSTLTFENNSPQQAAKVCEGVRANPSAHRFAKQ